MEESKKTENEPEGFTLRLALVDAIPVLEFGVTIIAVATKLKSALFSVGAVLSTLAGALKVLWKILIATKNKNIEALTKQFKYSMIGGFALMLAGVLKNRGRINFGKIAGRIFKLPTALFFGIGTAGMCAMGIMGKKLNKNNALHNWAEEITNAVAQGFFMLGTLTALKKK